MTRNSHPSDGQAPVAAWYFATRSAGTRPRSLLSYPFSRAQARTATVSTALALRPPRAPERRAVAPTLRAWSMYFRCSSLCLPLRSIS
jgi:hypothetical protein